MVFKRSVFEIQKQRTKSCKDPSYGYGEIDQNVPKFGIFGQTANFGTFWSIAPEPNWDLYNFLSPVSVF